MSNNSESAASDVFNPLVRAMDIVITLAGLLGNLLVCAVFLSSCKLQNTNSAVNKLILHQSIIDLAAVLLFMVARLIAHPEFQEVPADPVTSQFFCKAWYTDFPLWSMYYTSTFNLVLIAFERYAVTCHVVWYRNFRLRGIVKFGFLIPWLLGFGTQTYVILLAEHYNGYCYLAWPNDAVRVAGGIAVFVVMFLLPITIMGWCYSMVILTLRKREAAHRQANAFQRSKNVVSTFVLITIAYVICWMPSEIEYLIFNLGLHDNYGGVTYYIFSILTALNMVVNPCIYTCRYKLFQRRLRNLLCPRGGCRRNRVQNITPAHLARP